MSLENLDISAHYKMLVSDIAEQPTPKLDTYNFKKLFMRDKAYTVIPNLDSWLASSFNTLTAFS
jgi:hypothetical protein